jgi:uncharacterized membrane protein YjdF
VEMTPATGQDSRYFRRILIITLILLAGVIPAAFLLDRRIWALDTVVLGAGLVGIFALRRRLALTPLLFALLAFVVLAHCWAVLGFFRMSLFGVEYDSYVHTWANLIAALVAFRYAGKFRLPPVERLLVAFLLVLGIGLTNELIEFAGYRIGGTGEGLFLLGPGDIGATNAFENLMTDFTHDAMGAAVGLALAFLWEPLSKRFAAARRPPPVAPENEKPQSA